MIKEIEYKATNFDDLLEIFYNKNEDKLKNNFEKLKGKVTEKVKEIQELARCDVESKIIWGTLSGVIPIGDIFIQSFLKKDAKLVKQLAEQQQL